MKTKTGGDLIERREAVFSDCEKYRYLLRVVWDADKPLCNFIGLNPSTADEMKDDPTIRRCKDFAKRWGCGGLLMTNIFAYRATDPKEMKQHPEPCGGAHNRAQLIYAAELSKIVVAAWGADGSHLDFGPRIKTFLQNAGLTIQCLRFTKDGHPAHPLYIAAKTPLIPFL